MSTERDDSVVYWCQMDAGMLRFYVAATKSGLCYVGSDGSSFEELETWVRRTIRDAQLLHDEARLADYRQQFVEYVNGQRTTFDFAIDLRGTLFQQQVWRTLAAIPYGDTCSYSTIADKLGRGGAARAVGAAIGANPVLIAVPCHRVVGKNGTLTGYRGGLRMKEALLNLEKSIALSC